MSILDHLADGDVDILAVLVSVGLWGLAPAAIQQDACCWPEADTAAHLESSKGGNAYLGHLRCK